MPNSRWIIKIPGLLNTNSSVQLCTMRFHSITISDQYNLSTNYNHLKKIFQEIKSENALGKSRNIHFNAVKVNGLFSSLCSEIVLVFFLHNSLHSYSYTKWNVNCLSMSRLIYWWETCVLFVVSTMLSLGLPNEFFLRELFCLINRYILIPFFWIRVIDDNVING